MTNVSVIASHRERSIVPQFKTSESSNDIDNVIETIERLRLANRQESSNQPAVKASKTKPHKYLEHIDESRTKLNIDDYDYKRDSASSVKGKTAILDRKRDCNIRGDDQKGAIDYERVQKHDDDSDSSDDALIERGPTKSQNLKHVRSKPYQDKIEQQLDPFLIRVTEEILRDKDCREKLEPLLQKLERTNGYWNGNQNDSQPYDANRDATVTAIENDFTNESSILEDVLNSTFQVAQRVTENNFISLQKTIEHSDCFLQNSSNIASGSESLSSSPVLSPVLRIPTNSPKTFTSNISQNFGFPSEITSAPSPYKSIPSLSPYQSVCSPSSSSQSYGEASSPVSVRSNRTSISSQISERFDDSSRSKNDYEMLVASNQVPNMDNNNEWWLSMDDILKSLNGESKMVEQSKKQDCSNAAIEGYNDASWNVFQSRDNDEAIKTFSGHSPVRNVLEKKIQANDLECLSINNLNDARIESSIANGRYSFPTTVPVTNTTAAKFDNYRSKESTKLIADLNRNTPWSSLYLPTTKASKRLMEKLNMKSVEKAMANLLKKSLAELIQQDEDGDTMLMCLVGNPDELYHKLAYLIPFVDRLSTIPKALEIVNNHDEDALYLAALNCPQLPFVAGYLAATMIEKGIDVSQRLYRRRGDTLIHSIAAQGDSHKEILAELLALTTVQGNCVFDLTKQNYDGKTALHVAIESHNPVTKGVTSVEVVRLLLKYGADPTINETKSGDNALHKAVSLGCDPTIVKLLLDACTVSLVNATNYCLNTPLHVATSNSNVPLEKQMEVCSLLIHAGSQTNLQNRQGKTPLALASSERKEAIRTVFHRRS